MSFKQLLVLIYGGKAGDSLNHMRYVTYMNTVACHSLPPRPERLPPTEAAAKQHILRSHIQAIQWQTLMDTEKKPEDWGWRLTHDRYFAIPTDLLPAPADLMDLVKCKCKTETRRPCSTMLCSCFKHGLPCLAACKNCCGQSCENSDPMQLSESGPEDDDFVELLEEVVTTDFTQEEEQYTDFDIPWLDEEVIS